MSGKVRNWRDLILGLVMLACGLYMVLAKGVVRGMTLLNTTVKLAQAATYMRILGGILALLSAVLVLRALGVFGGAAQEEKKSEGVRKLDWLVICAFAGLVLYLPMMDVIGFTVASILLMTLLTFLIRLREKHVDVHDRNAVLKNLAVAASYAVILVLVLEFMFTKWLHVRLP